MTDLEKLLGNRLHFRFWGRFGEWDDDNDEQKYIMIYEDEFAFEEYAPIKNLFDKTVFMLSTGCIDKNSKEIFQGDILKSEFNTKGIVIWSNENGYSGFVVRWNDGDVCHIFNDAAHPQIEIIGNIFENPELVK